MKLISLGSCFSLSSPTSYKKLLCGIKEIFLKNYPSDHEERSQNWDFCCIWTEPTGKLAHWCILSNTSLSSISKHISSYRGMEPNREPKTLYFFQCLTIFRIKNPFFLLRQNMYFHKCVFICSCCFLSCQ